MGEVARGKTRRTGTCHTAEEKTLLVQLCEKLRIAPAEASALLTAAESRAKRFLDVL